MSRTYKTKPWRLSEESKEIKASRVRLTHCPDNYVYYSWLQQPGVKRKKKRREETNWYWWRATPSWWVRLCMERPARRKSHKWETEVVKLVNLEDLEDEDFINTKKKPHVYYY